MCYTHFDAAVCMVVKACGIGAPLAKCDIKMAFHFLLMHPEDISLLGFCFEDRFYIDRALLTGCSISCVAFETLSSYLEWSLKERAGLKQMVHYLGDLVFCGTAYCEQLMACFKHLAEELGLPLAEEERPPAPLLPIWGRWTQFSSPADCLQMLDGLTLHLHKLLLAKGVKLKELVGHLTFAVKGKARGWAFLRHLLRHDE